MDPDAPGACPADHGPNCGDARFTLSASGHRPRASWFVLARGVLMVVSLRRGLIPGGPRGRGTRYPFRPCRPGPRVGRPRARREEATTPAALLISAAGGLGRSPSPVEPTTEQLCRAGVVVSEIIGTRFDLGPVRHLHPNTTRDLIVLVRRFAQLGTGHGLHVLRPAPSGLHGDPSNLRPASEIDELDTLVAAFTNLVWLIERMGTHCHRPAARATA